MRIYVGTYGKYNNGSIAGAWMDVEDYASKEEFYAACQELHSDEDDAELMFQDWEGIPACLIRESWVHDGLFELAALDEDTSNLVLAYIDDIGLSDADTIHDVIERAQDACYGRFDSDLDFAYEYIDDTGMLANVPDNIRCYFNYGAFARDLMMDFFESNGYYFSNY